MKLLAGLRYSSVPKMLYQTLFSHSTHVNRQFLTLPQSQIWVAGEAVSELLFLFSLYTMELAVETKSCVLSRISVLSI